MFNQVQRPWDGLGVETAHCSCRVGEKVYVDSCVALRCEPWEEAHRPYAVVISCDE